MSSHTWELMGLNVEGLLSLLVITPNYDAKECMRFCCDELKKLMTENVALACLQLESWIQMEKEVQSLNKYAFNYLGKITMYSLSVETKDYFVSKYKDFEKFQEKLLDFPLNIIQAIISNDCLEVRSEDVVYTFVCKWAKANYHPGRARCDVLRQLARYIRFRYMSPETLRKFSKSHEFEPDVAPPIVLDALFFKAEVPLDNNANRFRERVYKFRPVKVLRFQLPQPACSVYFDLPHSVCKEMFLSGHVHSEKVELGRHALHLCAACESQQGMEPSFGPFLVLKTQNPITVDVQFEARAKPSKMFKLLYSSTCTLTKDHKIGSPNLFNMVWPSFIEEDAEYFCGGALYFRAEIKLRE